MSAFLFTYPWYLWLPLAALALAALGYGLHWLERRRQRRVQQFADAALTPRLLVGYDERVRRPLWWLMVLGFAALALTIAQPHWGQAWQQVNKQSRDILVLLDTSESMNATDLTPSRLARAKYKVASLMERLSGDRFGLIAFSGGAALQCPPTNDHGYFRAVLDAVDTDTLSLEGTDIGSAFREAMNAFRGDGGSDSEWQRENRAILLISDGEQVAGDALAEAEEASRYARIYVMGVGDPRGTEVTLPEMMSQYGRGGTRPATHVSKLDEDTLIEIAKVGNGRYVRSQADDWDVDRIHEFMADVSARATSDDLRLRLVNRFQWPLAVAIFFFTAEGIWWGLMPLVRRWRTERRTTGAEEGQHV